MSVAILALSAWTFNLCTSSRERGATSVIPNIALPSANMPSPVALGSEPLYMDPQVLFLFVAKFNVANWRNFFQHVELVV